MPNSQPTFPVSPPHPHALREQHAALQPHIAYPFPSSSSSASPHRQKSISDDHKYLQKYRDLKQKVKDIELDNDRLHLKVLKAKKNIQRLRIERAILYERLSAMPIPDSSPQQRHQQPLLSQQPPHPQYTHPDHQLTFPLDAHAQIQADKDRRRLDAPQRGHPGPPDPRPDPSYGHARPTSPPRVHHLDPYPPGANPHQPHLPMELDRQPPPPSRSRRSHPTPVHAHLGPSREDDRNSSLPVSLPPPPNTLPFPSSHSNVRQSANAARSPHLERDERAHGPPEHVHPHYPGPPLHRVRDRDHERSHLGGPGLPPMRTHSDAHTQSPRPTSSSSHNGYAHPLQHPFSSPDDRAWERERDFASYSLRGDDHLRERERRDLQHDPGPSNGYRDGAGPPPHRYEPPPNHGNGSALPSPDIPYTHSRRSSQGHIRADSGAGGSGRTPAHAQERDAFERREFQHQQYDYSRRQDRDAPDVVEGQARRRSFAEMEEERDRERAHEAHRPVQKQRRGSQDEPDERQQMRRDAGENDRDVVPRVREGEAMD